MWGKKSSLFYNRILKTWFLTLFMFLYQLPLLVKNKLMHCSFKGNKLKSWSHPIWIRLQIHLHHCFLCWQDWISLVFFSALCGHALIKLEISPRNGEFINWWVVTPSVMTGYPNQFSLVHLSWINQIWLWVSAYWLQKLVVNIIVIKCICSRSCYECPLISKCNFCSS